jgi:2-succinyl-6-hydroxy-2,4-cyclohexadiene-1-carboxylate synthase
MRIIALHGFTGDGTDFDALRKNTPESWQWLCPDLPGHGTRAVIPPGTSLPLAQHLALLDELRLHFTGKTPCVLLGYSMGGRLALHWALQRQDAFSALVLIGASPGLSDPATRSARRHADEALAASVESGGVAAFFEKWWESPLFTGLRKLPPDTLSALRTRRLHNNTAAGLASSLRGVGTGTLPPLEHKLPLLRIPVLCIAGSEDEKFAAIAHSMAERLPAATVALVPGAYHSPHLENPSALAHIFHEKLDRP